MMGTGVDAIEELQRRRDAEFISYDHRMVELLEKLCSKVSSIAVTLEAINADRCKCKCKCDGSTGRRPAST